MSTFMVTRYLTIVSLLHIEERMAFTTYDAESLEFPYGGVVNENDPFFTLFRKLTFRYKRKNSHLLEGNIGKYFITLG